jgi:predicted permease
MSFTLRELWARFVSSFRKRHLDQDFEEEVRAHIELAAEENRKRGMSAAEARRQAYIQFGGLEPAKELHRDTRELPGLEDLLKDFRFSLRQLGKSPGFAITAILSLALGIGATTAMFSLIYAVLIHPYPYAGADRIVNPVAKDLNTPPGVQVPFTAEWFRLTGPQFEIFRKAKAVDDLEGFAWKSQTITGGEIPENVGVTYMTANVDSFNKVLPLLGREIMPFDAPKDRPPQLVVVLSYRFWQRRYNGDPKVIGRTIQLDGKNYTIIGVRSRRNTFGGADMSAPAHLTADPEDWFTPYIKLKPGVSLAAANAEFQALLEQFAKETPKHFPKKFRVQVQPLIEPVIQRAGQTLFLLFAAVILLLLIGCANCSILLLARGTVRQHELAVRSALGASRTRIVRQLLSEALILSLAGSAVGMGLAYYLAKLPLSWLHDAFPSESAIEINLPVLCFSIGMALLTGVMFGLFPALRVSRPDLIQTIHASVRRATGGTGAKRFHYGLVAGQVAITLLLLAGATAASAGFLNLLHVNLGFDPHNTLAVDVPLHQNSYMDLKGRSVYFDQLQQKVLSVPGVSGVAIAGSAIPPSNAKYGGISFETIGKPKGQEQIIGFGLVSPSYFGLLHIPLLQGRVWNVSEMGAGARLAVINASMAHRYWPEGDPIGKQIRLPAFKAQPPFIVTAPGSDGPLQIIGVVGDARNNGLVNPPKPAVYLPYTILMWTDALMVIRTAGDPIASLSAVRKAVQSLNPEQEIGEGATSLEDQIREEPEWAQERIVSVLFSGFAILALTLAAVGLYSVVSYGIMQRTNEFGIRMALGAQRREVLRLVLSSISVAVGGGLAVGVVLIVSLNRLIGHWVQGGVRDPTVVLGVVLAFTVIAGVAAFIPARRASSIDPMQALRHE